MELFEESVVPGHARAVEREAREFAEEHIEPVAEGYYRSGEYPWDVLEAGMDAGLIAQGIGEEYGGRGWTSTRCSPSRRSSTARTRASR